jgi:hypothetical protein
MSIVTMKRKSNAVHSNVSKHGFYLQGKLRQPPHNDIRTPTYTRFKGTAPVGVGSGSHCRVSGNSARACKHGYPIILHTDIYNTLQTVPNVSTQSQYAMVDQRFRNYTSGPLNKTVAVPPPSKSSSEYNADNVNCIMNKSPMVGEGNNATAHCPTKTNENTYCVSNRTNITKTTNKYIVANDTYLLKYKARCATVPLPKKVWHTNTLIGNEPVPEGYYL